MSHKPSDCIIKQANDTKQLKCANCKENQQHAATDSSCPKFTFIQNAKHGQSK